MIEGLFVVLYALVGFTVLIWLSYGACKVVRWLLFRGEQ